MKIYQRHIEQYDAEHNKSLLRELEMLIDSICYDQGMVIQFFRDLKLYGIREAMAYLRQNFDTNPAKWPELETLSTKITEQVTNNLKRVR